jgi:hypothetical protein
MFFFIFLLITTVNASYLRHNTTFKVDNTTRNVDNNTKPINKTFTIVQPINIVDDDEPEPDKILKIGPVIGSKPQPSYAQNIIIGSYASSVYVGGQFNVVKDASACTDTSMPCVDKKLIQSTVDFFSKPAFKTGFWHMFKDEMIDLNNVVYVRSVESVNSDFLRHILPSPYCIRVGYLWRMSHTECYNFRDERDLEFRSMQAKFQLVSELRDQEMKMLNDYVKIIHV